jgi:glycosyltransferase involved in cell wall biosynthesis
MAAVHQFVPGLRGRDAVGAEILAWRDVFRSAGYDSEIFVGLTDGDGAAYDARLLHRYEGDGRGLLICHHAIGNDFIGLLTRLPDRLLLRYHNLTPSRFFAGNRLMMHCLEQGYRQTRFLRDVVIGALVASSFSADDLRAVGYAAPLIVPSVFSLDRLRVRDPVRPAAAGDEPLILFVGRGAPNKRQDHVVRAFEEFAQRFAPAARLVLAGNLYEDLEWGAAVVERIHRSPLRDRILYPGPISDDELSEYYGRATLFLSMSEHEGFCVPVLESFARGVPVLAYRTPAVVQTMGGAGVVFARKQWPEIAALMAELCLDGELRRRVVAEQRERLDRPDLTGARERLLEAIEGWLPGHKTPPARPPVDTLHLGLVSPLDASSELAACTRALALAWEAARVPVTILADPSGTRAGVDPPNVERILSGRPEAFVSAAIEHDLNVVHLALQPTLHLDPHPLSQLIDGLRAAGLGVFATVHGPLRPDSEPLRRLAAAAPSLARCAAVFTHREREAALLRSVGVNDCRPIAWGVPEVEVRDRLPLARELGLADQRVVSFLGRPSPESGLREAIEAAFLLRPRRSDLLLLVLAPNWPGCDSEFYLRACRERIERLDLQRTVLLFERPMSQELTVMLLAVAEAVLMPASETWSDPVASLRLPLAAARTAVAPRWLVPDGAADAVWHLPALTPQVIARTLDEVLQDDVGRARREAAARAFAREHAWSRVAATYLSAYRAPVAGRTSPG